MFQTCGTVILIIDALDECLKRERTELYPFLKKFRDSGLDLHLLVTSRWEVDIQREMSSKGLCTYSLSLVDNEQHINVLTSYISTTLSSSDYDEWKPHVKEKARQILESKADGM